MRPPFIVELWKPSDDTPHLLATERVSRLPRTPIRRQSLTFEWAKLSECGMASEHCCFLRTRMTSLWIRSAPAIGVRHGH